VANDGDPSSVGRFRRLGEEVFDEEWEGNGAGIYDESQKEANV